MKQTPSFFKRQSEEVQTIMARMARDNTTYEILCTLKEHGVFPKYTDISYYRREHGIKIVRNEVLVPAETFDERVGQYIEAIDNHNGRSWSNSNLGCKHRMWARCATKLCNAGLIYAVARRPHRYELSVPYEKMVDWYENGMIV